MGLLNARNLRKAKRLLDQNRHKVGDMVEKAGDKLDDVTKGKTSEYTSKATEAAKKYSAGAGAAAAADIGDAPADEADGDSPGADGVGQPPNP